MCWRDNIVTKRYCATCGEHYNSDLGHRFCPGPSAAMVAQAEADRVKRAAEEERRKFICEPCKDKSKETHPDCEMTRPSVVPWLKFDHCECPCAPPF